MLNRDFASKGCKVISSTDAVTGPFFGFATLEETVISALAAPEPNSPGPENTAYAITPSEFASLTIPTGMFLPVRCSSITLSSGALVAYIE